MPTFNIIRRPADIIVRRMLLPILPARLKLAINAHWWRMMGDVEPEILDVPLLMPPEDREVALDIGANNGIYSYHLARRFRQVQAFEANPVLAAELERQSPGNLSVRNAAISSKAGESLLLRVPVVRGQVLNGWASVETPSIPEATEFREFRVNTVSIDSLQLEKVSLIKIDVEGHEFAVLEGVRETLRQHMPWLIVEAWDVNRAAVCRFLGELGYKAFTLHQLNQRDGSPQNLIFLPPASAIRFGG